MAPLIRTRRASACAALLSAAAVALAGCSSSSQPAAAGSGTITPGAGQSLAGQPGASGTGAGGSAMPGMTMSAGAGTPASNAPAASSHANTVMISNFAFSPAAITVKAGTTVTWTNKDTDAHTVTSQNNSGPLGSSALSTGQSYSYKFTKAGTYSYLCTIHPFMTATVTVTP
jgi:plastocyanin